MLCQRRSFVPSSIRCCYSVLCQNMRNSFNAVNALAALDRVEKILLRCKKPFVLGSANGLCSSLHFSLIRRTAEKIRDPLISSDRHTTWLVLFMFARCERNPFYFAIVYFVAFSTSVRTNEYCMSFAAERCSDGEERTFWVKRIRLVSHASARNADEKRKDTFVFISFELHLKFICFTSARWSPSTWP